MSESVTRRLIRDVLILNGARMATVVVTVIALYFGARALTLDLPILLAMAGGLVVALAASATFLRPLRARVNEGIAAVDAHRNERRGSAPR
ncbi:DUF4229 domain-containing protein [Williamsia sp. 1135]|jgi:hypothetical protein|uniref:DUF4229 domain-containing protein n=1 Tax=Williamsia sp. 1135 TaxID=1889262 RepID=UPI000A10C2A0|nr:DUF4229 domain-containing protein [Williamsia sp. 1135]ORM37202.1 hypothetical protein BFL43_04755 [Williamsia sp. 1135]